jgi:hypothetical protein
VFRAGYEVCFCRDPGCGLTDNKQTLKHLDASIGGNAASVSSLTSLVSSLPQGIKRAPRRLPTLSSPDPSKEQVAVLPPKTSVLQVRPYAKVSGPRHVPILAQVQGIPFLRLKKPQPEALSRALQHKLQKRIDLFDERVLLNNYWLPCARQEDIWDEIIREELGTGEDESGEDGTRWTDMVGEALNINVAAHDKELAEDKRNIRIMSKIVAEETQLAEQEGQKVVRGRQGKTIKSHWLT